MLVMFLFLQIVGVGSSSASSSSDCPTATQSETARAACLGEVEIRAAAVPQPSERRREHLQNAATHFRNAAATATKSADRQAALLFLLTLFDYHNLRNITSERSVAHELFALYPADPTPLLRLASFEEQLDDIEGAEVSLLEARRALPVAVEPARLLAQFYARRAAELRGMVPPSPAKYFDNPGHADSGGVYSVGGDVGVPNRTDRNDRVLRSPDVAAAGIAGTVLVELVVDTNGAVSDATVVRSVPMLDEMALDAVRRWRFDRTIVNGAFVPVRMVVAVPFSGC